MITSTRYAHFNRRIKEEEKKLNEQIERFQHAPSKRTRSKKNKSDANKVEVANGKQEIQANGNGHTEQNLDESMELAQNELDQTFDSTTSADIADDQTDESLDAINEPKPQKSFLGLRRSSVGSHPPRKPSFVQKRRASTGSIHKKKSPKASPNKAIEIAKKLDNISVSTSDDDKSFDWEIEPVKYPSSTIPLCMITSIGITMNLEF
jgi:hypothetical protein